jgi:hypothetical protein
MKTSVEINGYVISIEENEGVISVNAVKDDEVVEEFTIETEEAQGEESGEGIKGFEDYEEEDEFGQSEEEDEDENEFGQSDEDEDEEDEEGEEFGQDVSDEETEESALESFQSFINKKRK